MTAGKFTLLIIIAFMSLPPMVKGQSSKVAELENSIKNRQEQLENIRKELESRERQVDLLETQEKDHSEKIKQADHQLSLNNRMITKTAIQLKEIDQLITGLEDNLARNQTELELRNEFLEQRLVWIYKRSRISPELAALNAGNLLDSARRLYQFSILNRYDRTLIAQIENLIEQIEVDKRKLAEQRASAIALKRENEEQARKAGRNRAYQKELLKEVKDRKQAELQTIEDLSADQNKIASIIDVLLENREIIDSDAAATFEKLKGKLIWPVKGKIIRKFGKIKDKKYNTTLTNPGIDIQATAGIEVYAASSGEVMYISWLRGYGSFVILGHGGGYYTLYAQLDRTIVEVGQFITAGETIATVGNGGATGEPTFHFELRYGKEQLDPELWLR